MQWPNAKREHSARRSRCWGIQHVAVSVLLLVLICPCRGDEPSPADRLPVPKSGPQAKALKPIKEKYRSEYAKRTPEDQLALSKLFREQAAASKDDPVTRYVLLREARELAVNAGDFDAAFGAIEDMSKLFNIDATELKVSALTSAMDRALIPPGQLMDNYLKVADAALIDGDVTFAAQASMLASRVARGTRSAVNVQRAREMELRVHDASRNATKVVVAARKLQANPDDGPSNLMVGRYLCFIQGKWDEGLPLLAKGSDSHLRDLAEKDLESPPSASAMSDLADRYWDMPDTKDAPQRRARQRAAYWYAKALPNLSEEKKSRAEQRIAEIEAQRVIRKSAN